MNESSVFSPRVLLGWVAAAAATFALSFYLMTFGGAETWRDPVGPSAFSRSAIGYAGFAELLQRLGLPVVKGRGGTGLVGTGSVLVVAEPSLSVDAGGKGFALAENANVLLVLPKWHGFRSPSHPGWIDDAKLLPSGNADRTITLAGAKGRTVRVPAPEIWTPNGLGVTPTLEASVQVVKDSDLRPIVAADGGILVGEKSDKGRRIWILSDPDIISNHGLLKGDNAEFGVRLVNALRVGRGAVVFDETVHGYRAPTSSPLRLLFQFPFIFATAQALVAIALLLWATMTRFGKPEPAPAFLGAGKQGLIHNAAHLLEFGGGREIVVASYIRSTIRNVGRRLRAPRHLDEAALVEWLDRVGKSRGVAADVHDLARRASVLTSGPRTDAAALARAARDVHRWKLEMLDGP